MRDWNKKREDGWPERIAIRKGMGLSKWRVLPILFRKSGEVEIYVREKGD